MSSRDIRRKYGQNYLKDPAILFEMGEVISPNDSDKFIEIGPVSYTHLTLPTKA